MLLIMIIIQLQHKETMNVLVYFNVTNKLNQEFAIGSVMRNISHQYIYILFYIYDIRYIIKFGIQHHIAW